MSGAGANVKSVENLDYFRSCLSIYITKARRSLDEVSHEVKAARQWLQHDQRVYWQAEYKRRKRKLDQAKAELLSAKMSNFKDSVMVEEMAVARATELVREAEQKLTVIKKWLQVFDSRVEVLAKRLDTLRFTITEDLPKGVHTLSQVINTPPSRSTNNAASGFCVSWKRNTDMPATGPGAPSESSRSGCRPPSSAPGNAQ